MLSRPLFWMSPGDPLTDESDESDERVDMANLLEAVKQAGVVGAGGAGFPTYQKLDAQSGLLIANGAECEPLLNKDQVVMQHYADELLAGLAASDVWVEGAFALEQGFIFTSLVLAAVTVAIIDRRFASGARWCLAASVLSAVGLMHAYAWTPGDTVIAFLDLSSWSAAWSSLRATAPFSLAYLALGLLLMVARRITVDDTSAEAPG